MYFHEPARGRHPAFQLHRTPMSAAGTEEQGDPPESTIRPRIIGEAGFLREGPQVARTHVHPLWHLTRARRRMGAAVLWLFCGCDMFSVFYNIVCDALIVGAFFIPARWLQDSSCVSVSVWSSSTVLASGARSPVSNCRGNIHFVKAFAGEHLIVLDSGVR